MNSNNLEQYNILSLLPYTECAQLISKKKKLDDLYFFKSVIDFSLKGLECFIQGHLSQFDAQVGENLCQIRAYRIIYIWKSILNSSHLKNKFIEKINVIKEYQRKLDDIITQWEEAIEHSSFYNKELDEAENVNSFLNKNNIFLELNEEIVFVVSCFFLTYFNIRSENMPVAIDLVFIAKELSISKYRAKKLTQKYQQTVCKLGCDFIMKVSSELNTNLNYLEILPKFCQVSDEDRTVLPCYTASEIIFHHSIKEKIPIFLCVKRKRSNSKEIEDIVYFLLVGNGEKKYFSLVSCEDYLTSYCMVVSGDMEFDLLEHPQKYALNFLEKNPLKLILANTATHPQYSGKKLSEYRNDPFLLIDPNEYTPNIASHKENLIDMKNFALSIGCSKENPSTFFLRHFYASQVIKEVNELKCKGSFYEAYKILHQEELVY
jgi:hypothetical protein